MAEKSMELKKELQRLLKNTVDEDDSEMEVPDDAIKILAALRSLKLSGATSTTLETGESSSLVIPKAFLCPISGELMKDPVLLETGQTYDRPFIQKWFHKGHDTCPQTKKVLSNITLTPNHLARQIISQWCMENGLELPKLAYEEVAVNADESHLNALLQKMSSPSLCDQKEAAKELRQLTKWDHPFRALFAKLEESVKRLLQPLTLDCINIHPDLQEDLITTVLNLSIHEDNKRNVAEDPLVLSMLIKSLEHGTIETKANAAAALFTLASLDSNKIIIGKAGALKPLIALLAEGNPVAMKDAASAIFNICIIHENKGKAICDGAVKVILRIIMEDILVDELLCILALLSTNLKAIDEMCEFDTVPCMLRIIRETDAERIKENCVSILYAICINDRKKLREVWEDERVHGTISRLEHSGNSRARRKAAGIVERLNRAASITHTA